MNNNSDTETITDCDGFDPETGKWCHHPATGHTPGGLNLCSAHLDAHWEKRQQMESDYPDSDIAPAWFDPTYAGERWDDDY